MRLRPTAALATAALALTLTGCDVGNRNVVDVPDGEIPEADTTPYVEPATPAPANEAELPNDGFPPDEGADEEPDGDGQP